MGVALLGQEMKNAAARFRKNRKKVESSDGTTLFTRDNYLFSTKEEGTKEEGWEETLYFRNSDPKLTGRLRQEHEDGPLAKIDKVPRAHLFLSEKRFNYLKRWYKHEQKRKQHHIPKVYPYECCLTEGKRHIEFACKGKRRSHWHHSRSKGIVKINKNPERLVRDALNKVCGGEVNRAD
jgi:hypothetical protein